MVRLEVVTVTIHEKPVSYSFLQLPALIFDYIFFEILNFEMEIADQGAALQDNNNQVVKC